MNDEDIDVSMGDTAFHNKTMCLKHWRGVVEVWWIFNLSSLDEDYLVGPEAKVMWLKMLKESDDI